MRYHAHLLPTRCSPSPNNGTSTGQGRLEPPPQNWLELVGGDRLEAYYLWHGLSASTWRSYRNTPEQYARFYKIKGYPAPHFPAVPARSRPWIAAEAEKMVREKGSLAGKSLKRKVGAFKSYHDDMGWDTPIINGRVERVIRVANRWHGISKKDQPIPITLPILRRILTYIRQLPSSFGGATSAKAVVTAFTLAFACFLRMGEFTHDKYDERFNLSIRNFALAARDGDSSLLTISASKTDPFRKGVTVVAPLDHPMFAPCWQCKNTSEVGE